MKILTTMGLALLLTFQAGVVAMGADKGKELDARVAKMDAEDANPGKRDANVD